MTDARESRLIELAVERGMLTRRQADACRDAERPLELLLEQKALNPLDLQELERAAATLLRAAETAETVAPEALPREFGPYTLLSELGRGGMGVVYRAVHKSMGRHVALKVLARDSEPGRREILARFQREAQVMARLAHPNIVSIHDFGVHEEQPYIAMELVSGMSLDRYLKTRLPPIEEALRLIASVARALAHAHAQGIVHRDIKPGNVLVDTSGIARLTDFGLAKSGDEKLTLTGAFLGTPMYMSPEQAQGRPVDTRSDVFSLGNVLYEAITGRPPFAGTTLEAIVHNVVHQEPVAPRVANPALPRDVESVCLKALAKDPARRYGSAQEFAEDLERLLRGESILARPPSLMERAIRRFRQEPQLPLALALVVVCAGAAVWFAHLLARERSRNRAAADAAEAERLYRNGRYAEALAIYERLGAAGLERAVCLAHAGRPMEAETAYRLYLDRFPGDAAGWRLRGLNALDRTDWPLVAACYGRAAELAHVAKAAEAREAGEIDVLVALVERHFLPLDPAHARPHLAHYDPSYVFIQYRLQDQPPYGLSTEWRESFPPVTLGRLKPGELDAWFAKWGDHPILFGWRAYHKEGAGAYDRAIALLPISRQIRLLRFLATENASDRAALRALCPRDPVVRVKIARHFDGSNRPAEAMREYESLYEDSKAGKLTERWTEHYSNTFELLLKAAACAARAGLAAETVRLLRREEFRRRTIASDPRFTAVLKTPEMVEYLETLKE